MMKTSLEHEKKGIAFAYLETRDFFCIEKSVVWSTSILQNCRAFYSPSIRKNPSKPFKAYQRTPKDLSF